MPFFLGASCNAGLLAFSRAGHYHLCTKPASCWSRFYYNLTDFHGAIRIHHEPGRKVVPPKKQILKDISLSFFPGAKIGVLGLNGAGKSTLLRIMAGVDKEFEGEARPMPGINVGYLPQEPQLDDEKKRP